MTIVPLKLMRLYLNKRKMKIKRKNPKKLSKLMKKLSNWRKNQINFHPQNKSERNPKGSQIKLLRKRKNEYKTKFLHFVTHFIIKLDIFC